MQTVIDLSEIYNQAGRVYCCNKDNESPVCYADKYTQRIRARALYHDFGFSAPLNSDSEGTKNRLLVIGRYFSSLVSFAFKDSVKGAKGSRAGDPADGMQRRRSP